MNRLTFIKKLFTGSAVALIAPQVLTGESKKIEEEFSFNDLFITHKGNDRLIYPKKDSDFYNKIKLSFNDRLDLSKSHTYLPVHSLSIPIKETYRWEDFLPIKYYFECVYGRTDKYTIEGYEVSYRFVKDNDERMHLEVFLAY